MSFFRNNPLEDLVVQATNEKNVEDNWELILDICDKAVNYEEGPKLILQAIAKRLYNNIPRVVIQALLLLDACVKNCGKRFHLEVSSRNFVTEIRKLLQKMHPTTVDKLKSLIKKWAENDFKDDPELGLIPSLYYQLKSEGVQFPEATPEKKPTPAVCTNPDAVSSQEEEEDMVKAIELSLQETKRLSTFSNDILDAGSISEAVKVELLKVRALYDFEAVEENELTIKAGEIVLVTDKSNESWWKGTNQRGEGYFPVNFVTYDLDADIQLETEIKQPEESKEEEEEEMVEKPLVIDEGKIQMVLDLLNEAGPMDKYPEHEEMLALERECYAMAPLVEEKLQEIDKKFTVLDSLNDEIMKAIQTYNKLTRDSILSSQSVYYYSIPGGIVQESEPTQDPSPVQPNSQSSATMPRLVAKHANPVSDNTLYISSSYVCNPTNLTSAQIRPSVINVPIAYPTQCHLPQYATLLHKPNVGQHPVVPISAGHPISGTVMSHPVPLKANVLPLEETIRSRTVSAPAGHDGLPMPPTGVVASHNQNFVPVYRQYPAAYATAVRNVFSGNVYGPPVRPLVMDGTPISVSNQQIETSVTQAVVSPLENTTITSNSVTKQEVCNSQVNTGAVFTNNFSENSVPSGSVTVPRETQPGNVTNQNASII